MTSPSHSEIHRDDTASGMGMWVFIFTELLLFAGLFLVYSVFRFRYSQAFHLAAEELDTFIGTVNTIMLLISSATIAMSVSAIQKNNRKLTLLFLGITVLLGLMFLVNKYFEWGEKFSHGIFPGSGELSELGHGDTLFFGLYFAMTGLHALHLIIGLVFIIVMMVFAARGRQRHDNYALLENSGLYWHLVDIIWIFLFPLFYLIT